MLEVFQEAPACRVGETELAEANYVAVSNKLKLVAIRTLWGIVMLATASCAGSQPQVNNVQVANQGLRGTWVLKSYRPLMSLDVPLAALVNPQLGQMRVTVQGTRMTVQGPGVQVVRAYQVLQADGVFAIIAISAPTGESVRVSISIEGNVLTFRPLDAPWTGEGTLQRL